ncbi:acyl-CoA-binding protein [Mycena pura]|uniref:Acyl-CoA-binding protein n=1 Tax=Mycena pura TaxID=153505 RepID=A0AAD6YRX8_9AGAR|nr:acyl-CoA-binding protein [Mycena pura]
MSYEAQFNKAVEIVKALPKDGPVQPTQDDQLYFYSYFKQGALFALFPPNLGDNDTTRPGMFDFVGKAKWDAWDKVKGTSKEDACKKYVERLIELLEKADDPGSKAHIEEIQAAT